MNKISWPITVEIICDYNLNDIIIGSGTNYIQKFSDKMELTHLTVLGNMRHNFGDSGLWYNLGHVDVSSYST